MLSIAVRAGGALEVPSNGMFLPMFSEHVCGEFLCSGMLYMALWANEELRQQEIGIRFNTCSFQVRLIQRSRHING